MSNAEQKAWSNADAMEMVNTAWRAVAGEARYISNLHEAPDGAAVWLVSEGSIRAEVYQGSERVSSWTVTSGSWLDRLYVKDGQLRRVGPGNDRIVPAPDFVYFTW